MLQTFSNSTLLFPYLNKSDDNEIIYIAERQVSHDLSVYTNIVRPFLFLFKNTIFKNSQINLLNDDVWGVNIIKRVLRILASGHYICYSENSNIKWLTISS